MKNHIEISQKALIHNYRSIKELCKGSTLVAVLKSNAYGHGYKEVVKEIENLVNGLSVATTEEALEIRRITNKSILCMEGPYDKKEFDLLIKNKIDLVIH